MLVHRCALASPCRHGPQGGQICPRDLMEHLEAREEAGEGGPSEVGVQEAGL